VHPYSEEEALKSRVIRAVADQVHEILAAWQA
jgi:membrane-bound ClpP family serine protease